MSISISVKKKFVVNGREYGSLEEMPAADRDAYAKAMQNAGPAHIDRPPWATTRIVFNGHEYPSKDEMPPDVSRAYDAIMKTISGEDTSLQVHADLQIDGAMRKKPDTPGLLPGRARPGDTEPLFSKTQLLLAAAGILVLLLYYFFCVARSR